MATREERLNAAKVTPSRRTAHQQWLVDSGRDDQAVRNTDAEARRQQRIHGS